MSFLDDAIASIGQSLAQTAISEVSDQTGINVGGVLNSLFGGDQDEGGQNLNNLIADLGKIVFPSGTNGEQIVADALNKQTAMIEQMSDQIVAIQEAITQITGEIAHIDQLLQLLQQEALYSAWSTADGLLGGERSRLKQTYIKYGRLVDYKTSKATPAEVQEFATEVLDVSSGRMVDIQTVSAAIVGSGQQQGLLQLWSEMVQPLIQGGVLDYRDAVSQYMDYYRKLAYAQLQGINAVMEADNVANPGSNDAADDWATYRSLILQQEVPFITWLIPLIYSAEINTSYPRSSASTFTAAHAAMQLDPNVQRLNNQFNQQASYYEPSEILREAEELLAKLYVTGPDDRRIVVHMAFTSSQPIGPSLSAAKLTLSGKGGSTIHAAQSEVLGGPYPYPAGLPTDAVTDFSFLQGPTGGFYVGRFIYSTEGSDGLPDGVWTLTSLDDKFPPVAVYGNNQTPMMNPSLALHPLRVGPVQQFDFMNFMAYANPYGGPAQP